jgi:hypothetical protein
MSPRTHQLTRILTALAVALPAVAGTLGVPTDTPDPISAPTMSALTAGTLGLPVQGGDPISSAPAIFDDPLHF